MVWTITEVTGSPQLIVRNGGEQTVSAGCPANQTPISGHVNASAPDDLRRLRETFSWGGGYSVELVDFTSGGSPITISATVRCVPTSYFGLTLTQTQQFAAAADHIAGGTVVCPAGYVALHASFNWPGSGDVTILSVGSSDRRAHRMEARAYRGNVGTYMELTVRCVPAADMANAKSYVHSDPVGWGAGASATCATGMVPVIGGTVHVGGDSGAITIFAKPTASGWTSTTLSTSTGNMQTTVICMPSGHPTVTLQDPPNYTNASSVSWPFTAVDPAAGTYTMSTTCVVAAPGRQRASAPCTSPVNLTGLADGAHSITVHFDTFTVDTVAPTVTFADASGKAHATTTPTIGFTVDDATSPVVAKPDCWVDADVPAPCNVPSFSDYRRTLSLTLGALSQGAHALHVRPADAATNNATYDLPFTVDTTNPTVVFDDAPGVEHATASPTIGFEVQDATAVGTLQCWLDGAAAAPCAVPAAADYRGDQSLLLSGVSDGPHTLHVRPSGRRRERGDLGPRLCRRHRGTDSHDDPALRTLPARALDHRRLVGVGRRVRSRELSGCAPAARRTTDHSRLGRHPSRCRGRRPRRCTEAWSPARRTATRRSPSTESGTRRRSRRAARRFRSTTVP